MWVNLAIFQMRERKRRTKDEKKAANVHFSLDRAEGNRAGKLFDNFFISFYLWTNFLNLMIGLSCSLWRGLLEDFERCYLLSTRINSAHQCLKKIYCLIIASGRLHTFIFSCLCWLGMEARRRRMEREREYMSLSRKAFYVLVLQSVCSFACWCRCCYCYRLGAKENSLSSAIVINVAITLTFLYLSLPKQHFAEISIKGRLTHPHTHPKAQS